jgi:hypothetical protein
MSRKTTDIDTPGKHGRVSRRHAGQSEPAMPMHRSIRMALPDRRVQRAAPLVSDWQGPVLPRGHWHGDLG